MASRFDQCILGIQGKHQTIQWNKNEEENKAEEPKTSRKIDGKKLEIKNRK